MRRAILLGVLFLVATIGVAAAQPYGDRRPAPRPVQVWDSSGWQMLGEQVVDYGRRADRDRINVGRYEGRFSKLTIVVLDSDLELLDFTVNFPRGNAWKPALNHYFRENQRTRVIDLPGDDRVISSIDLRYNNLPGGGRARVQVWGFKNSAPPPPPPREFTWDNRGWQMLGEQLVDYGRRADRDRITVGRYEGRFSKLTVVVLDSDLELLNFQVNFPRGRPYQPAVNHYFRENQRTRVIDLPGDDRVISSIDLKYKNLPGGGRARVQVWGFKYEPPPPPPEFTWDNRGWQMLGEQIVDYGRRADRDRITVGRYEGRFSKLNVVVLDSDLELLNFQVNFPRGRPYQPAVNHYFRENQRTRAIDLPGDDRVISSIDLRYKNLPGGGRARVQVWGFKYEPPPPPREFTWDNRGWQMLGEQVVDYGRRADRDRITVGRYEGRFSKLNVVVLDSDLELLDFQVNFPRGRPYQPAVNHYFRENQRTRAIDLPGDDRVISSIDLRYKNLPGGGRARVQVWGFKTDSATYTPPPPPREFTWDNRGWRMLGEQVVDYGRRADRDRINVSYDEGRFEKLMIVVLDSDLELLDFEVQFKRGDPWRPEMKQYFREGTRTRSIDLPPSERGNSSRKITHIDMKYKNIAGGGRARIQVWGK